MLPNVEQSFKFLVCCACASVDAAFEILFTFGLSSLTSYIILLKPNCKELLKITCKYLTLR